MPLHLRRLPGVVQEVHGITDESIVLRSVHASRCERLEMVEFLFRLDFPVSRVPLDALVDGLLEALQLRQDVRHRRVRQAQVVRAGLPRRIDVERLQELVEVVHPPLPRHQRQVRRRLAEPGLGVGRRHAGLDVVHSLVAGRNQVLVQLGRRDMQIRPDPRPPQVLQRVASQAVGSEIARSTLQ